MLTAIVHRCHAAALLIACSVWVTDSCADEVDTWIADVATAGPQAVGAGKARLAAGHLASQGCEILPRLLLAMDTPNIVAANWYRTAYQAIVAREAAKANPEWPLAFLRQYVQDPQRQGRTRRLVLSLLDQIEPAYRPSMVPTLLDDPEFREDAVTSVLKQGDGLKVAGDIAEAVKRYRLAFEHARESSQVTRAADRLKANGAEASILEHMGFISRWQLMGPFDAPGRSGFDTAFPPEANVDLEAVYVGQNGLQLRWQEFATTDRLGQVNLVQAIAAVKEAVAYAYCEIQSPVTQAVQLRCGADDNLTVWLNGKRVLAERQWLNGTRLDRFSAPVTLQAGKNTVLVKICQGPQHKNPAVPNNWSLQLRFCDTTGKAANFRVTLPGEVTGGERDE